MIALKEHWKTQDFGELVELPYAAHFDEKDFERLKRGLIPKQMEDKWFVYFEDNTLFFHRSWTGKAVYQVKFEPRERGATVNAAFVNQEYAAGDLEPYASTLASLISNSLLVRKED